MSRRRFERCVAASAALVAAVFACGCLTLDEKLTFNRDLSGRARMNMTMDIGAVVNLATQMFSQDAAPTGIDMTAMIQQEIKQELGDGLIDVEAVKKGLPAGVTLANVAQTLDNLKLTMSFDFQLTDMRKLAEIALPPKESIAQSAGAAGAPKTPMKPFDSFVITDDGTTILIASVKPAATGQLPAGAAPPSSPAPSTMSETMMKMQVISMMGDILKGVKISCAIESPMAVVESNATTNTGGVLGWEMKLEDLMKPNSQAPTGLLPTGSFDIKLRLKK